LIIAGNYKPPTVFAGASGFAKALSLAVREWQIGGVLRYASGIPFRTPNATTNLNSLIFRGTLMNRVPGQPLYTTEWVDKKGVTHTNEELDINCGCFDPRKTFVLNPKAWENPPLGQFGVSTGRYGDFRQQRRPTESVSLARTFRITEGGVSLTIRAEFTNIFNRMGLNVPSAGNPLSTQTYRDGFVSAGYGYIDPAPSGGNNTGPASATAGSFATPPPRQGTLVLRLQF
jgi:hypothetical protein